MEILKARRNKLNLDGLIPALIGMEGWRIEAIMANGERERFTVGVCVGTDIRHLKLKSRRSKEGTPIEKDLLVEIKPLYKK